MSPIPNGSSALQFEHGNAIEICNGIMFDFYPRLPHFYLHRQNTPTLGTSKMQFVYASNTAVNAHIPGLMVGQP